MTDRMDKLYLIHHLRRRHFQFQEEWVKEAGAYYLLTQGFTHNDSHLLPQAIVSDPDKELELRRLGVEDTKRRLDELEAEIQRIYQEAGRMTDEQLLKELEG